MGVSRFHNVETIASDTQYTEYEKGDEDE